MAEQGPMTEAMYYILLSLLRPGHGYGMMGRIKELSGGRLEMGPGTLYGVLSRMSREGLIVLTGEEGRRKTYAITPAGREALLAEYESCAGQLEELNRAMESGERVGFGLATVHERLRLLFGSPYGLTLSSQEGVGTTVTVRVPRREKELT